MNITAGIALNLIPGNLGSQPVFLCIDDTMVPKSGKKFEDVSKLFDHAAHNGSNYLNGHCFVSVMLCVPVWNQNQIRYVCVPLGYSMWLGSESKLKLAASMVRRVIPELSGKKNVIMNVALILAGGSGSRTEQSVPKQFISIYEKPIIIYTLEVFQKHPGVDGIIVSCIDGWHEVLRSYAAASGITKLRWVVGGGDNGQSSARNALLALENVCRDEDIVIIHDAVRPMVSQKIITDCIAKAEKFGSGLSAVRCQETIMKTEDGLAGHIGIDRNDIMRVQTPQAYQYGKVLWAHKEALNRGITNAVYTNTLMLELGEELHFSYGSNNTTLEDIDIFKALYATKRDWWLKKKRRESSDEL